MKKQRGDADLICVLLVPVAFVALGMFAIYQADKREASKRSACSALVDAWYTAKDMPPEWRKSTRQSITDCGIDLESKP